MNQTLRTIKNFLQKKNLLLLITAAIFVILASFDKKAAYEGDQKAKPGNEQDWVVLNIKFKPKTTSQMKEACIKVIKEVLNDSAAALKKTYPKSTSKITVDKSGDNIYRYTLRVTKSPDEKMLKKPMPTLASKSDSSTIPRPCTCSNGCQICIQMSERSFKSPEGKTMQLKNFVEFLTK